MRGFKDIGPKGHFSAKKGGFWVKKPPQGVHKIFWGQNNINKTQYDWFPGKSQNSKKFHTKNQEDSQLRLEVIGQKLSKQSMLAKK